MPICTDTAAPRDHIKLGLLREAYQRGLLTQAQLAQLVRRRQAR